MWYSQNEGGSTVLMAAVQSGKHEVLGVVLRSMKSIRPKLSNDQVRLIHTYGTVITPYSCDPMSVCRVWIFLKIRNGMLL